METINHYFNCKECGQIVSQQNETCPNCGAPSEFYKKQICEETVSSIGNDHQKADNRKKAMSAIDSIYQYVKICYYIGVTLMVMFSIVGFLATGDGFVFFIFLIMALLAVFLGKGILKFWECILAFFRVIVEMADDVNQIRTKINP